MPIGQSDSLISRLNQRLGFERDWYLILIAAAIGVLMGAVATAFILPLRWVEKWTSDSPLDSWIMMVLVVVAPAIGGILAGACIHYIGGSTRGPGVSVVMYAVHRERAKLPLRIAVRKWVASTLTIGSGGSAGAEGPIVTIGATLGSNLGQWLRMSPQNTATLLGCGAAAGIASIFNAPIAGIFFCLEILLRDFSLRTFTPIVIASVISAVWTQTMLDQTSTKPLFDFGADVFASGSSNLFLEIPNYFLLGIVCGLFAPMFVKALFRSDELFKRIRVHPIIRPAIGGAILGLIGLGYLLIRQPDAPLPPFFGNGYPVIKEFLSPLYYFSDTETHQLKPAAQLVLALLAIAVLKAIGTCLSIGSGGAGGMFAPSLLMGAGVGGAVGVILHQLNLFPVLNPAHFALVGMAAMVAGTTHAPLTGIFIVYEITKSEDIVLPLMLATVISTIVSRLVSRDSVYTWKLSRMGVRMGAMSDLTILRRLLVQDVPLAEAVTVHPNDSAQRLLDLSEDRSINDFVVVDHDDRYVGMVVGTDLRMAMLEREAIPLLLINELERTDLPTVSPEESLDVVLDKFSRHDVHALTVLDPQDDGKKVLGLMTRDRLMRHYQEALQEE